MTKQNHKAPGTICLLFLAFLCAINTHAQQALYRFAALPGTLGNISFSRDGSLLIACSDQSLTVYDIATGHSITTIPAKGCTAAAISPNNNLLLVGNNNNELEMYTLQNGYHAQLLTKRKLLTHISSLDFRADGRYYAIGTDDGRISVLDAQRPAVFATIMEAVPFIRSHAGNTYTAVNNLRFIDNDRIMAFAQDGEVKAFDVNSGKQIYALEYYRNVIYSAQDDAPVQCAATQNAEKLLCCRSGNAFMLDLNTYDITGRTALPALRTAAIAPSGDLVLACDSASVYVLRADLSHQGSNKISLPGISGQQEIRRILISPSGNKVLVCTEREIFMGDYQSFQKLAHQ